jgi:hypothetical protein
MNLRENINRIKSVMGVIAESDSSDINAIKRRIKNVDIDKIVDIKLKRVFNHNDYDFDDFESFLYKTSLMVAGLIFENVDSDDYDYYIYSEMWEDCAKKIRNKYRDKIKDYFVKRLQRYKDSENSNISYSFIKHSEPSYNDLKSAGFGESFTDFDYLVDKFGDWVKVDWDKVKNELDKSDNKLIRLANPGDEGNTMGYYFSVKKVTKNLKEGKEDTQKSELPKNFKKVLGEEEDEEINDPDYSPKKMEMMKRIVEKFQLPQLVKYDVSWDKKEGSYFIKLYYSHDSDIDVRISNKEKVLSTISKFLGLRAYTLIVRSHYASSDVRNPSDSTKLQEQIRKILREEMNLSPTIKRRINESSEEDIDNPEYSLKKTKIIDMMIKKFNLPQLVRTDIVWDEKKRVYTIKLFYPMKGSDMDTRLENIVKVHKTLKSMLNLEHLNVKSFYDN